VVDFCERGNESSHLKIQVNFLISWATIDFPRRTLCDGQNSLVKLNFCSNCTMWNTTYMNI